MTTTQTWKVGAVAAASGLTVRTLHHWDSVGLLSPSGRSPAGHREYTEENLVRLYQVLALRSLGLSLESIATCLDVGVDPLRLVRDHMGTVREAISGYQALLDRLERLERELAANRRPTTSALLDALAKIGGAGPEGVELLRRHLDPDQIQHLERRGAALGPTVHYLLEVEWPELYRRADGLRTAGVEPGDPRVQKLVARMQELSVLFSGGEQETSGGVRAAWREDPAAMSGQPDAPVEEWRALADYLEQARNPA